MCALACSQMANRKSCVLQEAGEEKTFYEMCTNLHYDTMTLTRCKRIEPMWARAGSNLQENDVHKGLPNACTGVTSTQTTTSSEELWFSARSQPEELHFAGFGP